MMDQWQPGKRTGVWTFSRRWVRSSLSSQSCCAMPRACCHHHFHSFISNASKHESSTTLPVVHIPPKLALILRNKRQEGGQTVLRNGTPLAQRHTRDPWAELSSKSRLMPFPLDQTASFLDSWDKQPHFFALSALPLLCHNRTRTSLNRSEAYNGFPQAWLQRLRVTTPASPGS